jgi:hypothetical protein
VGDLQDLCNRAKALAGSLKGSREPARALARLVHWAVINKYFKYVLLHCNKKVAFESW